MLEVDVYKLRKEKTLEEAVTTIAEGQIPEIKTGRYEVINGIRYLVVADTFNSPLMHAYTVSNGHLVFISLMGNIGAMNNSEDFPKLFDQILSHIDYTCKGDCSVNADPVTVMGKEKGGEE